MSVSSPVKPSVVFCGIVRDCGRNLSRNLERVQAMRSSFSSLRFVLVENDSQDDTKDVLRKLQREDPSAVVEICDYGTITLPKKMTSGVNPSYSEHRISKLSAYRNRYLELIEQEMGSDPPKWIVMVDWDIEWFSVDDILSRLGSPEGWGVTTANARFKTGLFRDRYFDAFAYRALGQIGPCTEESIVEGGEIVNELLTTQEGLIEVESGFNALAIYRASDLKGFRYRAEPNDNSRVEVWCEHVTFHRDLAQRGVGSVVIDPQLRATYNTRLSAIKNWLIRPLKMVYYRWGRWRAKKA